MTDTPVPYWQTLTRVRHTSGLLGWHNSPEGVIRMDGDPLRLSAYWRSNPTADQEDYGVPPAGYFTAYGYWLPVTEDEA